MSPSIIGRTVHNRRIHGGSWVFCHVVRVCAGLFAAVLSVVEGDCDINSASKLK